MSTTQTDRTRVTLAAAISMILATSQVAAQEAKPKQGGLEEVIVTGSLIEGTPEDTALPVEVIGMEDLENLGRPSNMELVKTLSEVGSSVGETNRFNGFPVGAATVNLRNLGSRFTTVVFNGRRFPEQYSATTGRFNNIAWIPNTAVGRVEVLKEGGAATYGADAIGGVVNYITRRNLDGLEIGTDYRYIEDSDGDYDADLAWGTQLDDGNILVVAGYQHRSALRATDRDWSQRPMLENKTTLNWSANGSPGSYVFQTPGALGAQTSITPLSVPTADRHMSAGGTMRDPACTTLGGFSGWTGVATSPSPACYVNNSQFENLVEKSDSYQFYAELNKNLGGSLELHSEALYYQLDSPTLANYPGDSTGGASGGIPHNAAGVTQAIGVTSAFLTPGANPAVRPFLQNTLLNSNGSTVFSQAQIDSIVNSGRVGLQSGFWRTFGNGGNPLVGEQDEQHNNTQMYRLTTELSGDLPEFWGTDLGWRTGLTYSHVDYKVEANDMLVDRLQAALNGLGGPNCSGSTPGQNGCQWFNPFSSAIASNPYTGQVNPGFVSSLANSADLIRWMRVPIWLEREYNYLVFDGVFSGSTGLQLPGGPMAVALGVQYRYSTEEFNIDDLSNRRISPCGTVGATNCTTRTGPLVFGRNATVLGTTTEDGKRNYPVAAGFFEMQFPLLESLNFQVAGRYEKFFSDISDIDNDIFVPAAALKWQALDWLAVRTSAGRTFSQVNPPRDDGPTLTGAATANPAFGGIAGYSTANYDNVDVESEKGEYFSTGFMIQAGNFTSSIDYWDVRVDDYTRTMNANHVLTAALLDPGAVPTTASLLNCASAVFAPQAQFGGQGLLSLAAPCVQGTTNVGNIGAGSRVNFFGATNGTNSGELKTNGIDFSASYRFDNVLGGTLTPSVDVTYNLTWELADFTIGGVPVAKGYDGLGYKNGSTGRVDMAIPEWRGGLGLLYANGRHSLNILARYIPSVINENPQDFDASHDQNANIGDANGRTTTTTGTGATAVTTCNDPTTNPVSNLDAVPAGSGTGEFGAGSVGAPGVRGFCGNQNAQILSGRTIASTTNVDLTYRVELPAEISMALSVYNVLNDEPSFDRASVAYNSGFGSPLERNFKLSLRKRF